MSINNWSSDEDEYSHNLAVTSNWWDESTHGGFSDPVETGDDEQWPIDMTDFQLESPIESPCDVPDEDETLINSGPWVPDTYDSMFHWPDETSCGEDWDIVVSQRRSAPAERVFATFAQGRSIPESMDSQLQLEMRQFDGEGYDNVDSDKIINRGPWVSDTYDSMFLWPDECSPIKVDPAIRRRSAAESVSKSMVHDKGLPTVSKPFTSTGIEHWSLIIGSSSITVLISEVFEHEFFL